MTIQEAYTFFEGLKNETTQNSESKIHNEFLSILSKLKIREFSIDEIQSIETELASMDLESNQMTNKKHLNKRLKEFKDYLKEVHALLPGGYYTSIGISLGVAFGVVAGVVFGERSEKSLGLSLGISVGILVGLFIGRHLDSKAKLEGKVY